MNRSGLLIVTIVWCFESNKAFLKRKRSIVSNTSDRTRVSCQVNTSTEKSVSTRKPKKWITVPG